MAKDDACVCIEGYFVVILADSAICEKCDSSCKTCSGTATKCIDCIDETRVKNLNGECECADNYYELRGECVNSNCANVDVNCQECHILLSTGLLECHVCTSDRVLSADNQSCICPVGQYASGDACIECESGCQ